MPDTADDHYAFRHPVTRDGAYQLMPPSDRVRLHAAAAAIVGSDASSEHGPADVEAAEHLRAAIAGSGGYAHAPREWAQAEVRAATRAARWLAENFRTAPARALWERAAASPAATRAERFDALTDAARALEGSADFGIVARLAMTVVAEAGDDPAYALHRAHALRSAGIAAEHTGRNRDATTLLGQAVALARTTGNQALLAAGLGALANHQKHAGHVREAEANHREALAIARAVGDRRLEASSLGNLANILRETGRGDEADRLHVEVLALARTLSDRMLIGSAVANAAIIASNHGRTDEAIRGYREAIAIASETGNRRSASISIGNLASVMRDLGRDAESEAMRRQALQIAREVNDRRSEANQLGHIADIRREAGHPREAFPDIAAAMLIHRETGYVRGAAMDLIVLAEILRDLQRLGSEPDFPPDWDWPRASEPAYRHSLAMFEHVGDVAHQATVLTELAAFLAERDPASSEARDLRARAAALSFAGDPHG